MRVAKISSIEYLDVGDKDTYDITVKDNHNFFVSSSGKDAVLVHNCKYFIVDHIIGPVTSKVKMKRMTPTVKFIETGVKSTYNYKILAYSYRFLATSSKRNKLIVDWVKHDLKEGRSISIPVATVNHALELVKLINAECGKGTAVAFTRAVVTNIEKRKQIIESARNYDHKVTIGIRKMLQRGINVPRWDTLYEVIPISNPPNFEQETNRILTPMEGKNEPILRFFLDDFGFSRGCLRTCLYNNGMVKHKFKISSSEWATVNKYVKQGPVIDLKVTKPSGIEKVRKNKPKRYKSF